MKYCMGVDCLRLYYNLEYSMSLIDKKKIALIHIIKKELNLTDFEYRNILKAAAGVGSSKDLDEDKFRKLMACFVRSKHYRINPFGMTMRQKIYINNLFHDLNWSQEHRNNFVHKYYHKLNLDNLTKKEAIKLIESLKNIKRNAGVS